MIQPVEAAPLAEAEGAQAAEAAFTHDAMAIPEQSLARMRREIFHPEGPGYTFLRGFADGDQVRHMVELWRAMAEAPATSHSRFVGKGAIRNGCPNFYRQDENGNVSFMNFVWRKPDDELTFSMAFTAQMIRARLQGRPVFHELYPHTNRCMSYRMVLTRRGDTIVPQHTDWLEKNWDPARIQATLFLTRWGQDYEGEGFVFTNNQGQEVAFGRDVAFEPGDLVFWRYNNRHGVQNVRSVEGRPGFIRIIMPPEELVKSAGGKERIKMAVRKVPGAERVLRKVLQRARGLS